MAKLVGRGARSVALGTRRAEVCAVKAVPHGLRKNAVIALLEAGCTVAEVAAITGQSYAVVEHYAARVNTERLGSAAILKLDARRRNGT